MGFPFPKVGYVSSPEDNLPCLVAFFEGEVFDSYRFDKNNLETERCYFFFLQIYNMEVINAKGTTVVCEKLLKLNSEVCFSEDTM